ncbi:hypothetical protein [Erwinia phyllosphaerae]|uniref:hypothetical protein n=1 Tax=Erwinia phyllosphaerae TaxID=2853256 RepID=UPI001FEE5705|nr:hypothetical protein [Erwinia phyllosphaerae]MBV4365785.1 hypothetical protein [Erwinia phyllosphaerae]
MSWITSARYGAAAPLTACATLPPDRPCIVAVAALIPCWMALPVPHCCCAAL